MKIVSTKFVLTFEIVTCNSVFVFDAVREIICTAEALLKGLLAPAGHERWRQSVCADGTEGNDAVMSEEQLGVFCNFFGLTAYTHRNRVAMLGTAGGAYAFHISQQCLAPGHWTYECKNGSTYQVRASASRQLKQKRFKQAFLEEEAPAVPHNAFLGDDRMRFGTRKDPAAPPEKKPKTEKDAKEKKEKKEKKKKKESSSSSSDSSDSSSSSSS
ncbi:Zcchc10 [Symbiodinium pilosum]|uniref:Zcchc10 protein n=1 Tax=Symbiodinium pilosum TaxID=2952 RepID=A0A812SV97_SYMPI|nr:Zcchc10 [Symbiodinium pilosum]